MLLFPYPLWLRFLKNMLTEAHFDAVRYITFLNISFPIFLNSPPPFAAINGWSIYPPLRLSGHCFAAGAHREDPLSLHL